jgi:hypothetical protein
MASIDQQLREAVVWAYRLLLGREPESEAVIAHHVARENSIHGVRKTFLESPEFRSDFSKTPKQQQDEIIARFLQASEGKGEEGFLTDFLGSKTRCSYLPSAYSSLSGIVDGPPTEANAHFHAVSEWRGTLHELARV